MYYLFALLAAANDDEKGEAAGGTATAGPGSHHSQVSIPDEDPLDEAVTDLSVLAEVTLAKKPSAYSPINVLIFKFSTTYTTRI
jgi:hypothetical protein